MSRPEEAYSMAEMGTFHCEWVLKIPLSGLGPVCLLGLCAGKSSGERFEEGQYTAAWPGADDDDDMGLESVSDPEEVEYAGGDGDGNNGDVSSASHSLSFSASHALRNASCAPRLSSPIRRHITTLICILSVDDQHGQRRAQRGGGTVAPITPRPGA
ncbi:hypothetical protein K438DRAFT_1961994 [Mycena galopus ATCC 62051]|nr:hypothetical protein K438DRAFT_1961994 [Mycena galopus ATCC 62051]